MAENQIHIYERRGDGPKVWRFMACQEGLITPTRGEPRRTLSGIYATGSTEEEARARLQDLIDGKLDNETRRRQRDLADR